MRRHQSIESLIATLIVIAMLFSSCSYAPSAESRGCFDERNIKPWINEAATLKRTKAIELLVMVEAQDAYYLFGAFGDTRLKYKFYGGYDWTLLYGLVGFAMLATAAIWGLFKYEDARYNRSTAEAKAMREKREYMQEAEKFASKKY